MNYDFPKIDNDRPLPDAAELHTVRVRMPLELYWPTMDWIETKVLVAPVVGTVWTHAGRGTEYEVTGIVLDEESKQLKVAYAARKEGINATPIVRPVYQFLDGRFTHPAYTPFTIALGNALLTEAVEAMRTKEALPEAGELPMALVDAIRPPAVEDKPDAMVERALGWHELDEEGAEEPEAVQAVMNGYVEPADEPEVQDPTLTDPEPEAEPEEEPEAAQSDPDFSPERNEAVSRFDKLNGKVEATPISSGGMKYRGRNACTVVCDPASSNYGEPLRENTLRNLCDNFSGVIPTLGHLKPLYEAGASRMHFHQAMESKRTLIDVMGL